MCMPAIALQPIRPTIAISSRRASQPAVAALDRRHRYGDNQGENQQRQPRQSAHPVEHREQERVAPGQQPVDQVAQPMVQGERDHHRQRQDQHRNHRVRQPGEPIPHRIQGRSQFIHADFITPMSIRRRSCGSAGCVLDKGQARWQNAASATLNQCADAMKRFLLKAVHVVERPDLRHPGLDLAVRRKGRRGRIRQRLLSGPKAARSIRRCASSGAG